MSYRDNYPTPPVWNSEQANVMNEPEPYDRSGSAALFEMDAPDGSTQFLVAVTGDDFEESGWPEYFTYYGIEAPRSCKMRHAFEWCEISWRDYWTHKGWLLHMRIPFNGGPMESAYVSTNNLSKYFYGKLDRTGYKGPYEFKREQLELCCMPSPFRPEDLSHAEREYQEFMMRHGHKFKRLAA